MTMTAMQCREAFQEKKRLAAYAYADDLNKLPQWHIYIAAWNNPTMSPVGEWEIEDDGHIFSRSEVPGATADDAVEWWLTTERQDRANYRSIEARPAE